MTTPHAMQSLAEAYNNENFVFEMRFCATLLAGLPDSQASRLGQADVVALIQSDLTERRCLAAYLSRLHVTQYATPTCIFWPVFPWMTDSVSVMYEKTTTVSDEDC